MNPTLEEFLVFKSDKSRATRDQYRRCLSAFLAHLDTQGISPTGEGIPTGRTMEDVISKYIDGIKRKVKGEVVGLTPASKRAYLSTISSFYLWLIDIQKVTMNNPAAVVLRAKKLPKSPIGPNMHESEFSSLLELFAEKPKRTVPFQDIMRHRDHCIVHLAGGCGIRRKEIHGMDVRAYDRDRQVITVLGKGNKIRTVPVPDTAATVLCHYIDEVRPRFPTPIDGDRFALFLRPIRDPKTAKEKSTRMSLGNITDRIGDLMARAGMTRGRGPHTLRRSYGAWLLDDSGGDIRLVQEILGHANIGTTERYTALSNKQVEERARRLFRERGTRAAINSDVISSVHNVTYVLS